MTDQDSQPGAITLESLPGTPVVPFEAVYPLLSTGARLEIELVATRLVATQVLSERSELETQVELLAKEVADASPSN